MLEKGSKRRESIIVGSIAGMYAYWLTSCEEGCCCNNQVSYGNINLLGILCTQLSGLWMAAPHHQSDFASFFKQDSSFLEN